MGMASPRKLASEGNDVFDYKYDDVMNDILLRLPLKSLMVSKCVCKWWKELISDPVFKSHYSRRNPQHHVSGFFLQKFICSELHAQLIFFPCELGSLEAAPNPSLSFIHDPNGVRIQHSCNGLLLCSSNRFLQGQRNYYICKPTTKQYLPLPFPLPDYISHPHSRRTATVFGINIAYDPSKAPDYKVVCICDSSLSENHRQIKILSPLTGSVWKDSGKPFPVSDDEEMLFSRGVYWNGALHWIGNGNLALRFDAQREVLTTMPMPPIQDGLAARKLGYFGESGGHLFLIETYGPNAIDVMEMRADYGGWFVKYHLDLDHLDLDYFDPIRTHVNNKFSILYIAHQHKEDDEEEDESFMVIHVPGHFVTFRFKDYAFLEFETNNRVDEGLGLWYSWQGMYPYLNTDCYM